MTDPIRQPCQKIKRCSLMSRQDVANVGAVENIFHCREHTDPDGRTPIAWDEPRIIISNSSLTRCSDSAFPRETLGRHSTRRVKIYLLASIEEYQPSGNRKKGQEELTGNRKEERYQEQREDGGLCKRPRGFNHGQGEDAHDQQQQVLEVIQRPAMAL